MNDIIILMFHTLIPFPLLCHNSPFSAYLMSFSRFFNRLYIVNFLQYRLFDRFRGSNPPRHAIVLETVFMGHIVANTPHHVQTASKGRQSPFSGSHQIKKGPDRHPALY
jgi:hypothetical protein